MKIITLQRQFYTPDTTIGQIIIDGQPFCYSLEDTCRAYGVKVFGATAIPVTTDFFYRVGVTYSERFKKELPIIYTEIKEGIPILKNGGIEFTHIRFHGGNTKEDSSGCPLVAFNYDGKDKIYNADKKNRADDALTLLIKKHLQAGEVGLKVVNLPNKL